MNWQIIVGAIFLIGGIGNITSNIGAFFFGTIVGAVLILWGLKKNGILQKLFKKLPDSPAERKLRVAEYSVVGMNFYLDSINKLACTNQDWKRTAAQLLSENKAAKRIFRYNFINKPVKLVPEPENPYDANAIMVVIAGEKVGYISQDDNVQVNEILKNHEIKYISGFIGGGPYKVVSENGDIERFECSIYANIRIGYV